jgi:hypothetical protein
MDEVREGPLAVDLDDRDRGAVLGLELRVAADVDAREVACADLVDDGERRLAEVAALGVVDDDPTDRAPA